MSNEPLQPERQALVDALRDMQHYLYEDEYAQALGLLARLTATGYRIVAVPGATAINRYVEGERSTGADPLDVERLARALEVQLNRTHRAGEYGELAEAIAAEYALWFRHGGFTARYRDWLVLFRWMKDHR